MKLWRIRLVRLKRYPMVHLQKPQYFNRWEDAWKARKVMSQRQPKNSCLIFDCVSKVR